jgi:serine/threonine protein phosphatase 1
VNAACVWNIDTGAGFDGPLTLMDVNSKEYWQSDKVYTLYPDEEPRAV